MSPIDKNSETTVRDSTGTFNPSIAKAAGHPYNPKREGNAQNRNDTTGLDDEITESDHGVGEADSSSASGSVRNDDSGAV